MDGDLLLLFGGRVGFSESTTAFWGNAGALIVSALLIMERPGLAAADVREDLFVERRWYCGGMARLYGFEMFR